MKIGFVAINKDNNEPLFFPTIVLLADYLGCSTKTIWRHTREEDYAHFYKHDVYKVKIDSKTYQKILDGDYTPE
jgi:hypothetical protein